MRANHQVDLLSNVLSVITVYPVCNEPIYHESEAGLLVVLGDVTWSWTPPHGTELELEMFFHILYKPHSLVATFKRRIPEWSSDLCRSAQILLFSFYSPKIVDQH